MRKQALLVIGAILCVAIVLEIVRNRASRARRTELLVPGPRRRLLKPGPPSVIIRDRTKSSGIVAISTLPGWEAQVRDRGHRRGFAIAIRRVDGEVHEVLRTLPNVHWAQARDQAAQVLQDLASKLGDESMGLRADSGD